MTNPRPLSRQELARFLPDQRSIRAFEQLFDAIPSDLTELDARVTQNTNDITNLGFDTLTVTSSTTLNNDNQIILCNNTSDITITLPIETRENQILIIKKLNTGLVTISGGTIDGNSSLIIFHKYDAPRIVFTGSEWYLS